MARRSGIFRRSGGRRNGERTWQKRLAAGEVSVRDVVTLVKPVDPDPYALIYTGDNGEVARDLERQAGGVEVVDSHAPPTLRGAERPSEPSEADNDGWITVATEGEDDTEPRSPIVI